MTNVRVRLVDPSLGPDDARIVPVLADHGLATLVARGSVIEVPAEVAGEGPSWREVPESHKDPSGFYDYRLHIGEQTRTEYQHLGHGLLAQVGIWEPADACDESEQG